MDHVANKQTYVRLPKPDKAKWLKYYMSYETSSSLSHDEYTASLDKLYARLYE